MGCENVGYVGWNSFGLKIACLRRPRLGGKLFTCLKTWRGVIVESSKSMRLCIDVVAADKNKLAQTCSMLSLNYLSATLSYQNPNFTWYGYLARMMNSVLKMPSSKNNHREWVGSRAGFLSYLLSILLIELFKQPTLCTSQRKYIWQLKSSINKAWLQTSTLPLNPCDPHLTGDVPVYKRAQRLRREKTSSIRSLKLLCQVAKIS